MSLTQRTLSHSIMQCAFFLLLLLRFLKTNKVGNKVYFVCTVFLLSTTRLIYHSFCEYCRKTIALVPPVLVLEAQPKLPVTNLLSLEHLEYLVILNLSMA